MSTPHVILVTDRHNLGAPIRAVAGGWKNRDDGAPVPFFGGYTGLLAEALAFPSRESALAWIAATTHSLPDVLLTPWPK